MKASGDIKFNVVKTMISLFYRVENIVGKRKKCRLPAFSPFPALFSKGFFVMASKFNVIRDNGSSCHKICKGISIVYSCIYVKTKITLYPYKIRLNFCFERHSLNIFLQKYNFDEVKNI